MGKDAAPRKWDGAPHTAAKHAILNYYLSGWFPKLSWKPRILFFDGFAGRGSYNDGSEGSPIIALRQIVGHQIASSKPDTKFEFLFVEKDPQNARDLRAEVVALEAELGGFPTNITYQIENGPFEEHAKVLLDHDKIPVLAFIDPFGFKGMPWEVVRRFVALPNTEVFVNLMVDFIGRFGAVDPESLASAFGLPAEEVMRGYDDQEARHEHLRDLYIRQLCDEAGFKYVLAFAMHGDNGHVLYYLIYATNSEAGIELMKKAMWKADPVSGSGFHDRTAKDTDMLWPPEEDGPDLVPLEDELRTHYAGRADVPLGEIKSRVLLGPSHYRDVHAVEVVKTLEDRKLVRVTRTSKAHETWAVTFTSRSGGTD